MAEKHRVWGLKPAAAAEPRAAGLKARDANRENMLEFGKTVGKRWGRTAARLLNGPP